MAFLNYDPGKNLAINTFRLINASVGDLADVLEAIHLDSPESITVALEGTELMLLDNNAYWEGLATTPEVVNQVREVLAEFYSAE